MDANRKRLILDLDPLVQRRLKVMAATKGMSMRQYCLTAIERKWAQDEGGQVTLLPFGHEALDRLDIFRQEIFGDTILPGASVEFMQEARDSRSPSCMS